MRSARGREARTRLRGRCLKADKITLFPHRPIAPRRESNGSVLDNASTQCLIERRPLSPIAADDAATIATAFNRNKGYCAVAMISQQK